ncbi:MAG: AbrB/MazE/SpoVT family DNA-binding domain-containing protein [Candidatus Natronoplasma sp.]
MKVAKLSSKGQIVLPSELRKEFHLSKGDKLVVEKQDGEIVLKPITSLKKLKGVDEIEEASKDLEKTREKWDEEFE